VESFIGKLRDELLNAEIFDTLLETKVIIENWIREYNQLRPYGSLDIAGEEDLGLTKL